MTVKVCALLVPPPGAGLVTVTAKVPTAEISPDVIVAVSWVLDTNVVVLPDPFQLTTEAEMKLVPVIVRVKEEPPALALVGLIDVVVGAGLVIVRVCEFEVPPPKAGLTTVIEAVPDEAMSVDNIVAVI